MPEPEPEDVVESPPTGLKSLLESLLESSVESLTFGFAFAAPETLLFMAVGAGCPKATIVTVELNIAMLTNRFSCRIPHLPSFMSIQESFFRMDRMDSTSNIVSV